MSDEISEEALTENAPRRVGRPERLDDATLRSTRNHLVWLLENTWGQVGWKLQNAKTSVQVREALLDWQQHRDHQYIVEVLLRPSESAATAKLNELRYRLLIRLNDYLIAIQKLRQQYDERHQRASRASGQAQSDAEEYAIAKERVRSLENIVKAEWVYSLLLDLRTNLHQSMRDGHAYFARNEMAQFCKRHRYEVNPLNTANALAGLPFIGFRRSADRCRKWKCDNANGFEYQIFKLFRDIVESRPLHSDLIGHAKQWLQTKHTRESYALSVLRDDWYYLKQAIQTALDARPRPRERPFRITREYFQRAATRSELDKILAEGERIVI